MIMHNAEHEYQIRKNRYSQEFKQANRQYNIISNFRLLAFVAILASALLYYLQYVGSAIVLASCSFWAFIILIVLHEKVQKRKDLAYALAEANRQSIARITGQWVDFADQGEEYLDLQHQYSYDLDICGRGSLFQWINHTFTFLGREFLQNSLLQPLKSITKIKQRQEAIDELAEKLDWRQRFRAEGNFIKKGRNNPASLFDWAENESPIFRRPWLISGIRAIITITITSFLLAWRVDIRFLYLSGVMLLVQLVLLFAGQRLSAAVYGVTNLHRDTIVTFKQLLALVEGENFSSDYLSELQSDLVDPGENQASQQIDKLSSVVNMMNFQYGQLFYFLVNLFFLYDYHCMFALEKWKQQSGNNLRTWFTVIGKFEEISSLAIIRYDNPDWCYPQFTNTPQTLSAVNMGHPLLSADVRVCNDLHIKDSGTVLLITGSNMSGKSTLLRTAGVNLVLAYIGAPVCAAGFNCAIMDIYSVMRVNDNLEKNISSFYAELLRIKTIVQAAGKGDNIFFLLDEIFKGTNSQDRHNGATTLIKKLSKMGAIGLVSTHDLELGALASEQDFTVENYHFSEHYANNEILFDYKLRPGISQTTNAIYLMRMVGIDEL